MTDAELRSAFERIDAMSERCDYLISRNRPLTPDTPPMRRPKPAYKPPIHHQQPPRGGSIGYSGAVASGSLTGNEMRISDYRPQPCEDDDPTGMWVAFESDFDDMVAGMN